MYIDEVVTGRIGVVFDGLPGQDGFYCLTGGYEFSSLAELDAVIGQWRAVRDRVERRAEKIQEAIRLAQPPADDVPSVTQARALRESLQRLHEHNQALLDYADRYARKLAAARQDYAATDDANAVRLARQGQEV